jgi:hypothetical protein
MTPTRRQAGRAGAKGEQASASTAVRGFIAKFDPAIARVVRGARTRLRRRFPTAMELVYDSYNALAIGYAPNERTSEAFVSIAAYARGVNLYFVQGKRLADPGGLLEGAGNQGRFLRLDAASRIDEVAIRTLLDAAVALGKTPLPASGRGDTVVKSVSTRPRPRRV